MKKIILTGLATEQDFEGGEDYFLVFNGGELRIKVTADAAETVVRFMLPTNGSLPTPITREEVVPRIAEENQRYLTEEDDSSNEVDQV